MLEKVKQLKKEIDYIENDRYKKNAEILVDLLPDYFFEVAASSTGKYHPESSLGIGGLLRHTKLAVKIASTILGNNVLGSDFTNDEKDLMILSLIMHDGLKHGLVKNQYTVVDHPLLMSKYVKENAGKLSLTNGEINFICHNIETHMGEWTTDYRGNEVLERPSDKYQKFVHLCDFLASRKFLDAKFDNNEIID